MSYEVNELTTSMISPLDNRYASKIPDVIQQFSLFTFTKFKLYVECEYLKFFCSTIQKNCDNSVIDLLYANFNDNEMNIILDFEKRTNHDVQALVEYMKSKVPCNIQKWVHFGLTSQDINSPAMVLLYKAFNETILNQTINQLKQLLNQFYTEHLHTTMLTFTHGQPATPSTFGKQIAVYMDKLEDIQQDLYESYTYKTKMGGSNGLLSGLKYCFPMLCWDTLMTQFVQEKLWLKRNLNTTQIDNYINYFKLFQIYERLCMLLINFSQDMWMYIHKEYLTLNVVQDEVGSSAMPHKVNPIHFENAEGNLKIAAALFHTIGGSICLSRLQRDLTDSTMLRNIGVACGHMILSIRNIITGFKRVRVSKEVIENDLGRNTQVCMEFVQLRLRQWDIENGYDLCKEFSRGNTRVTRRKFLLFLESKHVHLSDIQKDELCMDCIPTE